MVHRPRRLRLLVLCLLAICAIAAIVPFALDSAPADSPEAAVRRAWGLAAASGTYRYRSQVEQTAYPRRNLANTGRTARQERFSLEGSVDLPNETMELSVWPNSGGRDTQAMGMRVERGQTYTRVGQGAWKAEEGAGADMFAPGGDPLGFLAGLRDVRLAGEDRRQFATATGSAQDLTLSYTRYTFELDGPAFASFMQGRLEEDLRAAGRLPGGMQLDTAAYRDLAGSGEIWIDAEGLPRRLKLTMDLPPQKRMDRISAVIDSEYFAFDTRRLALASTGFTENPGAWLSYRLTTHRAAIQRLALQALAGLALVGLAGLAVLWRRRRRVYLATVSAVILSMLLTPLARAAEVEAFVTDQQARQATQEAAAEQQDGLAEARVALSRSNWQPNQDPLEAPATQGVPAAQPDPLAAPSIATAPQISSDSDSLTDSDGDGLSDADEDSWQTCPYAGSTSAGCAGVADPTDSDADGLTDGAEVNQLNTYPGEADTDGDTITDTLEVEGFLYDGAQWYLDPNESDTNRDGMVDSTECPALSVAFGSFDANTGCPDSDGDGEPDLFDEDNDGDGVHDSVDLSVSSFSTQTYDGDTPLALTIDNLEVGEPVLVDVQLRPTDASHINYLNSVLDWPTGDTAGQIQRRLDTTFATTANTAAQASDVRADNGDIRLIPMLEVAIPYTQGHYGNLPVLDAYSGTTRSPSVSVDTWLDSAETAPYGVVVRQVDETSGDLTMLVPLSTVYDETGGGEVAFGTQLIYWPSQGVSGRATWGAAHELRLIWLVQMLTDECIDESADADTCARQDVTEIIHVYDEEWQLTGMEVSEEHGLDVGVIYEEPADDDNLALDDELWMASWNLSNTFLRGRDCDTTVNGVCRSNGVRDVTIGTLRSEIDEWTASDNYLGVLEIPSYEHSGYVAHVMMTETADLLATEFAGYESKTSPTLLFAQEKTQRQLNLDYADRAGSAVTFDFDPDEVDTNTLALLSWGSYKYVDGEWANYDSEEYANALAAELETSSFFQAADSSQDSLDEAEGKRIWAQLYYIALVKGSSNVVAAGDETTWTVSSEQDYDYEPEWEQTPSFKGASYVAGVYGSALAYSLSISLFGSKYGSSGFWAHFKTEFQIYKSKYTMTSSIHSNNGRAINATTAVLTMVMVSAVLLYAYGMLSGDEWAQDIAFYALNGLAVIMTTAYVLTMVRTAYSAYSAGLTLTKVLKFTKTSFSVGHIVTMIIFLAATWGPLIYQIATGKLSGIAMEFAIAGAVAATIMFIIILALSTLPIIGLLVQLLALVDVILMMLGIKGAQDRATEWLAEQLFTIQTVIDNFDDGDRLDFGVTGASLSDPDGGFTVDNGLLVTMAITTELHHVDEFKDFVYDDFVTPLAKKTTLDYYLQRSETDRHSGLSLDGDDADWDKFGKDGDDHWIRLNSSAASTDAVPFANVGPGVNRTLDGQLYLTEAYALPMLTCWFYVGCDWDPMRGSVHMEVGQYLTYDILPATFGEFVGLGWNDEGGLAFPAQKDHDGDGLLNVQAGGTDTNDGDADTDDDGLGDYYEFTNGYGVDDEDSDGDGLDDAKELVASSDPLSRDTDGDGLDDYTEIEQGWLVGYIGAGGEQIKTRVWSSPLVADVDEDGLDDLQEFVFGLSPWSANDPSVVETLVEFNEMQVAEQDSPLLLARFEESEGSWAFSDSSGQGNTLSCDQSAATCPAAGAGGKRGSALSFDGANDYLEVKENLSLTSFTQSAWVYPTSSDTAFHGIFGYDGGVAARRAPSIYMFSGGRVQAGFGDGANWNSLSTTGVVLSSNAWNHIAATFDGTTYRLYINGVEATNTAAAAGRTPYAITSLRVGRLDNYFKGSIDEVAMYDRALAAAEIGTLMNGRSNPNDLFVAPGADLSYSTTVSNTLLAQDVNGHLIAETTAVDPALPNPDVALRFEAADRKSGYSPDSGESVAATCTGTTCPGVDGAGDSAPDFDGVDDYLEIDTLAYENAFLNTRSLSFQLKLGSWPAAGKTMAVIATDSSHDYGLNVAINSSGQLEVSLNGFSGTAVGAYPFPVGGWYSVLITVKEKELRMYRANGTVLDGGLNSNTRLRMVVGAGRLGNSMDGASPLDGAINDLKVINTSDETVFTLGFDENNSEGARTRFSNASSGGYVDCASTSTCPALVAGATNEGVSFDGVDDYLPLTASGSHNAGASGSVSFKLKLDALPSSSFSYLLDNNCSSADGVGYCLRAYIESSGAVGAGLVNRTGGVALSGWTTGVAKGFADKLGSWVTVTISWSLAASSGSASTFKISITHNGATTDSYPSATTTGTYWPLITTDSKGRFGARVSGNNPLKGSLDDLVLTAYNLSFDQQDFTVEQVNRVNEARVAACAEFYNCPTASAAGKFGSALSFDGVDDYLLLDRTVADDFTVAFWMQTTQSGSATAWWDGYGLIDGEVSGWANDFGLSLGASGQVLFGTGSASGLHTTVRGGSTADGAWHHVVATRVKQTGAMKLYIDGALVGSGAGGTNSLNAPPYLRLGMLQTGANPFKGLLDEVIIIPAAVDLDGARLLMQTTYPIIDVPADFTTFSLGAGTSTAVSGEATVSADAVTSLHRLEQQAEAAIELQSAISYPVNDSNYASMPVLMPFEEVPGEVTYNNFGYVTGYSQSDEMENPVCYTTIGCPISGLPGMVGRAAYFDGAADWLSCTYGSALGLACGSNELNVRTVAAWVKADGGTIADFRGYVGDDGLELDYNSLNIWLSGTTVYRVAIDLPENVWTHVAATVDMTSRTAAVYVNGALYGSTSLGASGTFSGSFPSIGANRAGSFGNLGSNGDFFHGFMDDLRAYTVTLTAAQIQQLYSESAPIMRFSFDDDESSATTVVDDSANAYPGALKGSTCNTVTVNWIDFTNFPDDGVNVRLQNSNELIASITTITQTVTPLNASASFCGDDALYFESISGNSTDNFGTINLTPTNNGATATADAGYLYPIEYLTANYTYGTSFAGNAPALADGKIGNKLVLDGRGAVEVSGASAVSALNSTFTIMGWINPDDVLGFQKIIASGTDASLNNGFTLSLNGDDLQFRTLGVKTYNSSASVNDGVWQHVAVVFDSGYDVKFYVNGVLKDTQLGTAAAKANTDDPTYLGGAAGVTGVLEGLFRGQLDEITVYDRELTTAELYSIYLRDLRWYSERASSYVKVDSDYPSVALLSDYAYRANAYTQLAVETADVGSYVQLVEFGLKGPSMSDYVWAAAPACEDSGNAGTLWCPAFDPTALGGAGTYQVQFRAVDAVGHETTSAVSTIYVDGAAPSASSAYAGGVQALTQDLGDDLAWSVALSGSLSDPAVAANVAGSGVNPAAVTVALYDAKGDLAGTGQTQRASVSGAAWSVSYQFIGVQPAGSYTIKVTAEDLVGNAATVSVGTVTLDARPSSLDMELSALEDQAIISETATLSGVVSEQANWSGELLKYHFEETSGASFDDSGSLELDASCSGTTCPSSAAGLFGSARAFDGANDMLTVANTATLELTEGTFSAWIKPTWTANAPSANPVILAMRSAGGTRYSWSINKNYATMELSNGSSVKTAPVTLAANQWAHVALVHSGSEWIGYLNGVPVGTVSQSLGSLTGAPLIIGASTASGEYFPGQIDELAIYGRALSAEEIYALAQSNLSSVAAAQVWLEPIELTDPISDTAASYAFEEPAGDFTFANGAGDTAPAACTTCPAVAGGQFGQALSFDGADTLDTGAGLAELGKGSFTLGAWVKTTATSQAILTKNDGDSAWERGEKSLYLDASGRPTFVGWGNNYMYATRSVNDGAWHHVAVSWSYAGGASGTATVYVDGVDVTNRASTNYGANNADNSADTLKIGRANHQSNEAPNNFAGLLDEVAIYDRALSPAEAALLGSSADAATWQSATISGSGLAATWSYALPANTENTYEIHARSSDSSGNVSAPSTVWRGVIDTKAPTISGTAVLIGGGVFAQTEYSISSADFFLDGTSLVHPCSAEDVVLKYDGYATQTTGASVSCTVSGWPQTMPTLKVCDEAGHCATAQVTSSTDAGESQISILSPDDGASFGADATVGVSGGAYDPQGIQKIVVAAGSTPIQTFTYNAGLTDTLWSTSWIPPAPGAYTITAAMTDWSGNTITDTIGLTISPVTRTLTVARAGTGSGAVSSAPAGIDCGVTCSASFAHGTVVTLTAAPLASSTFAGWSGACSGTLATCQVTLDQARSVTATFVLTIVTPTATSTATATPPTTTATPPTATPPTATATTPTATAMTTTPTATATLPTPTSGSPTATPPTATATAATPTATVPTTTHHIYIPLISK